MKTADPFHREWYDAQVWTGVRYRGISCLKCPFDLWQYQEIIHETRPEVVIECGVAAGGTTLFLADTLARGDGGEVWGIDVGLGCVAPEVKSAGGVTLFPGNALIWAGELAQRLASRRCMVILDDDHTADHVLAELDVFAPLVAAGCYLVVEDTNLNGRPVLPEFGPGPAEALAAWLPRHPEFAPDPIRERFGLTFNPGGYLRRVG